MDDVKEVRIFRLIEFMPVEKGSYRYGGGMDGSENRQAIELGLAEWLNAGWQIAGTGGEHLGHSFVILVRERQE
jgi:hypothetical protein